MAKNAIIYNNIAKKNRKKYFGIKNNYGKGRYIDG